MRLKEILGKRADTADFSNSNYEVIFSVFMVALAYFYRENALISCPEILYLFMSLLAANFAFSRIFSERSKVSLWLVDAMLLSNIGIITAILASSGGHLSYFWVLYLLPIFTAALTARLPEVFGATALCVLAMGALSLGAVRAETAQLLVFLTKFSVFVFSAFVISRTALARESLETEVTSKRFQVEKLMAAVSERDSKAQTDASVIEMGRMSASLLHDIGNVVTIILMSAEMMQKEEVPNLKDAKRVEQAARMAKSIINGALALLKGARYEFRQEALNSPMENAAAIFTRQARGKKHRDSGKRGSRPAGSKDKRPAYTARLHQRYN